MFIKCSCRTPEVLWARSCFGTDAFLRESRWWLGEFSSSGVPPSGRISPAFSSWFFSPEGDMFGSPRESMTHLDNLAFQPKCLLRHARSRFCRGLWQCFFPSYVRLPGQTFGGIDAGGGDSLLAITGPPRKKPKWRLRFVRFLRAPLWALSAVLVPKTDLPSEDVGFSSIACLLVSSK